MLDLRDTDAFASAHDVADVVRRFRRVLESVDDETRAALRPHVHEVANLIHALWDAWAAEQERGSRKAS